LLKLEEVSIYSQINNTRKWGV